MFSFIYKFLIVLVNATFFKNTFPKLTQTSKGLPYYRLTLIERMFWSLFPNVKSVNFNLLNNTTDKLLNFRKKHFSSLSYKISSYYSFNYNITLHTFNKFINFFLIRSSNFFNLKKIFKTKNDFLVIYIFFFFLKRNFYKYFSFLFFKEKNNFNLTKINYIFFRYFYRADIEKVSIDLYNLWKSTDWYNYNFNGNFFFKKQTFIYKNVWFESLKEEWLKKRDYFHKFYTSVFVVLTKHKIMLTDVNGYAYLNNLVLDYTNMIKITNIPDAVLQLKKFLPSRFSERSTNKFIDLLKSDNYVFFFIRKNKIFNKGRYSRNRQTYRTGFYWSLWVNIFAIYGLHFAFYRFTFNFGYLWVPFIIFFGTFLFARMLKYNFHDYNFIISELKKLYNWAGVLMNSLLHFYVNILSFFKNLFFDVFSISQNSSLNNSVFNLKRMDFKQTIVFEFYSFFSKVNKFIDDLFDDFWKKFFLKYYSNNFNSLISGKNNCRYATWKFIFYK